MKVALCAIGKEENLYALEFVNHYQNLGYGHIFIYDNNEIKVSISYYKTFCILGV